MVRDMRFRFVFIRLFCDAIAVILRVSIFCSWLRVTCDGGSPNKMESLPTVILSRSAAQRVVRGHPWIFKGMVEKIPSGLLDGELVQVRDSKRRPLGIGFWNGQSKLAVRIISKSKCAVDLDFFRRKIKEALRQRLIDYNRDQSFRLIHAEADGLSGLIVDLYGDVAVIQISSLGIQLKKELVVKALVSECEVSAVVERADMLSRQSEGMDSEGGILYGKPDDNIRFKLNQLEWEINWREGHKTGCYLDQQVNYNKVARLCRGKKVLDAFTFQGGFANHAVAEGAQHVVALDQSKQALNLASGIQKMNGLPDYINWNEVNVFDWLKEKTSSAEIEDRNKFDIIILDPPSFARNRSALTQAFRGYKELHLRALKLLSKDGILVTFSCSHHVTSEMYEEVVMDAAFDCRKILKRVDRYTQAPDHPIIPVIPETEYLKGYAYRMVSI